MCDEMDFFFMEKSFQGSQYKHVNGGTKHRGGFKNRKPKIGPKGWSLKYLPELPVLCNNSRSNIMDEAQITVMRMASIAPIKYPTLPQNPRPQINVVCPGKEIPNWFSYQNEGSSVNIDLPPDWFRTGLFGFALSVVSEVSQERYDLRRVRANFIVTFMGECHELFSSMYFIPRNSQHHVHVWNEAFRSEEVGKSCSPDVYKLAKEACVVFYPVDLEE
ncbi:protein suppressor of npr1-1 [Pyrus ussuriensis x Pyrus communis]|uniref:Protein suppressor of npr1-1 n=1 Tax=Pyrus ussuriensis x Pyrus communis TaxID=2448454 RepID=A0A5N5FPI5_9ROSA|nr:protein suppressor of npr1-1 [Pyrus ussuriensis x Pyrus communis]